MLCGLNVSRQVLVDSGLVEMRSGKLEWRHVGAVHRLVGWLLEIQSWLLVWLDHVHICRDILALQAIVGDLVVR